LTSRTPDQYASSLIVSREFEVIDKTLPTCRDAVVPVFNGATVMLGGFGNIGLPGRLLEALREENKTDLTLVSNGAGEGDYALAGLFKDGRVRKLIASFPAPTSIYFRERFAKGEVELELVPQGTLVERIRSAGAGLGGFYTPTAAGTELAAGKETRMLNGREYVFETPIHADFALIKAHRGDRLGNLSYRGTMRNFNMVMAMAAKHVVAEVDALVPLGTLGPEQIHTPGVFVTHLVQVERHPQLFQPQQKEESPT
jgi:3-oxoadipate CoA-transferase alpha subunit